MTAILGISAYYHDSAAALVVDGRIVAAAQQERFSRNKHDHRFPREAIDYCLAEAGIEPEQLDYVGFYDKPLVKFERLLETYLAFVPAGYRSFRRAMPLWLTEKLHLPRELGAGLGGRYGGRYAFADHHQSHAASAFFPSPFDEAAVVTFDGVGEWSTTCFGSGRGNRIRLSRQLRFPHSLGLLYSAFTYYAGFRVNSGEYKLMGLAPFGQPIYRDLILEHLVDLKEDGSYRMEMRYFNYCQGLAMTSKRFEKLFGGPPRKPESPLEQRHMDLAASIQAVAEEIVLRTARHVHRETGLRNLCLAGGVALNCVANGRILREGPFERVWIQPAAGDAGAALGVALLIWHQLLENPRRAEPEDGQNGSLLGPEFSDRQIVETLDRLGAVYDTCSSEEQLCNQVAALLAEEKVVGWFQGRMEFGPRALGARSILGDARSAKMQSEINRKIKFRESFRPLAPIVLSDQVDEYFEMSPGEDSPYMLLVAPVRERIRCRPEADDEAAGGIERIGQRRSVIPAVTHVDYSARVQTVDRRRNPLLHKLLASFREKTGCPVLVNTSFNVRGEPIVCTPAEAYNCFMMTDMDALVVGRQVLLKDRQKTTPGERTRREHQARFELD